MVFKKPAILLSSYSNLSTFHYSSSQSCTSCRKPQSLSRHTRHYAEHASSHPESPGPHYEEEDLSWPAPAHPHRTPTPYQILSVRKGEVYSKHRFYCLVKLYHPDRRHPSSPIAHLPDAIRIERYRLLVAAHTILSDDAKRKAYDLWGSGWAGHHSSPSFPSTYGQPYERKTWPPGHDPMYNATWEDWERWYDREYGTEKEDSRKFYMSNFGFMSTVFALISIGGIMQGTRANLMTSSVMEQRDKIHREASIELARSKRATMSGDRNERIKTFLEHREATNAGESAYQRLLPPSETCIPDTVRRQ
ncbi:hypothetical protein BDV96DRAFT_482684 [Lophiotrema nucula]|uniref:J domain-containing protein n=1 Tax=Lophiotrema nucula TaxID=690887 RepID=A0A6A5ZSM2_9PLEO|nr:hypothetical protein BDV96DRAFT_482684 [Lophiotrema nucula]